ncbi:hypothetical protein F4604DRAFT_1692095 [Suillus subluteus]|nr:hypothetical protein F4604DRAFT_1692095 [Suillus subluteus]
MSQTDDSHGAPLDIDRGDSPSSSVETRSQGSNVQVSSSSEAFKETPAARDAQHSRRITQLEEKLETLESGRAVKERQTNHFVAQGRAIRRVVALYDSVEDLIWDND